MTAKLSAFMGKQENKICSEDYDFVWRLHDRTYFDVSIWLNKNYLKRDFIITNKGKEWCLYLSKSERTKLSQYGVYFFKRRFLKYKKRVKEISNYTEKYFNSLYTKDMSSLNNQELSRDFLKTVKLCLQLWKHYWFTEYFLYDEIERRINEAPEKYEGLNKKVKEMQTLKFELRKLVNKTVFRREDFYIFGNYLNEIKKRTKIKNPFLFHYQELIQALNNESIKTNLNRENYVLGKFNNWEPIIGINALKIINALDNPAKKTKIIEGQIANKGYYKGKVRVIKFNWAKNMEKESAKLKKGEVLVTGSTIPQMMVACMNAGAIITEEGGIASHAAIISREFNKPCIIRTKIATKIFKTGDVVEVDATKGIARKVEK